MRWRDSSYTVYYLLGAIVTGTLVRLILLDQSIVSAAMVAVAAVLSTAVALLIRSDYSPVVLWNPRLKTMAVIRRWSVEVSAGCLFSSVPMGIDLSRSAKFLLRTLHGLFGRGENSSLRFFVVRPLGDEPTRVGLMLTRRMLCLGNVTSKVASLAETVSRELTSLESAVRSVYPHTPVDIADRDDLIHVYSGGAPSAA